MELTLQPKLENGQITVVGLDSQLEMARSELKKYNYVVTENNYKDAKKDRSDLNKLVKQIADARKSFEDKAFSKWKPEKAKIMDFEKEVKAYSDELAKGMYVFDEEEKEEKRSQIYEAWESLLEQRDSEFYDLQPLFNPKWLNKSTSAKQIEEDLKSIYDKIKQDLMFLGTFLPTDEVEAEQVRSVYFEEYDLTKAKMKADSLKALRERVESQKEQQATITPTTQESPSITPKSDDMNVLKKSNNTNWAEFRVEGTVDDLKELTKALQELKRTTNFTYKITGKGEL